MCNISEKRAGLRMCTMTLSSGLAKPIQSIVGLSVNGYIRNSYIISEIFHQTQNNRQSPKETIYSQTKLINAM